MEIVKYQKRWSRITRLRDEIFTAENKNPTFPSDSKGFARVLVADTRKQALRDKPCATAKEGRCRGTKARFSRVAAGVKIKNH